MTKFFTVNLLDLKSALVSGVLMALLVVAVEIIAVGSIFALDWKTLLNSFVIAFLTAIVSFLKALFTTSTGKIAGIKIK